MPEADTLNSIINANIESLEQGDKLVRSLTSEEYQYKPMPLLNSSIGEHFRHIADTYFALMKGVELGQVDFNQRRRGASIESQPEVALVEFQQIKTWLQTLDPIANQKIHIETEVALEITRLVELPSSLVRELIFASSDAVHHYALIAVITKLQNVAIGSNLGIAAATASHARQSNSSSGLSVQ
jgi:hypothetical protein